MKFTEKGQVELTVRVDKKSDFYTLLFDVKDSGIGIAPDRIETVFDTFTQADTSIGRRFGGTGLGLSITRQLVELMGGEISVTSSEGEGSTFTINLPVHVAIVAKSAATAADTSPLPISIQLGSRRLLIAEDHDINQALMRAMMRKIGIQAIFASNGAEAVEVIIAAAKEGQPFDLVLMDIQMPVMDGLEATRRLRGSGFDATRLPIVALTANAYAEDIAACLEAGMQDHLSKPVTLATISAILTRFIPIEPSAVQNEVSKQTQDITEEMPASLVAQYEHRKAETLAEAERLAGQAAISDAETDHFIDQLHKLAGTAGFFGDALLGSAANDLEYELKQASFELRPQIAVAGLAGLSNAQNFPR